MDNLQEAQYKTNPRDKGIVSPRCPILCSCCLLQMFPREVKPNANAVAGRAATCFCETAFKPLVSPFVA